MMKSLSLLAIILALTSCTMAAFLPVFPDIFIVTSDNMLTRYNTLNVSNVISSVPITGLAENEVVLDIDIRSSNQGLYGVALDKNLSVASLYTIDGSTGAAKLVGIMAGCTLYSYPTDETPRYGIDFDPVSDTLRIVGQDTQNFAVDPETGACTQGMNLFFNGNSGRGSTPTRAVAFSNTILPTTVSYEYVLTGEHFTVVNYDYSGVYVIRYDVVTDGPFDIHTQTVGANGAQVTVPLIATPTYTGAPVYAFDYSHMELRSISLETGYQELVGTFDTPAAGVYFYGMACIPKGWTGPTCA